MLTPEQRDVIARELCDRFGDVLWDDLSDFARQTWRQEVDDIFERVIIVDGERKRAWLDVVKVVYGGVPGGMPEGEADQLRAIADWMDLVDDATDKALDGRHSVDRSGSMQQSLRAIAERLSNEAA